MNSEQFTYWLQGFFELSGSTALTDIQVLVIKDHLKLVFEKKTPDRSENIPNLTTPGTIVQTPDSHLLSPLPWTPGFNPFIYTISPFVPPHTVTCGENMSENNPNLKTYC